MYFTFGLCAYVAILKHHQHSHQTQLGVKSEIQNELTKKSRFAFNAYLDVCTLTKQGHAYRWRASICLPKGI